MSTQRPHPMSEPIVDTVKSNTSGIVVETLHENSAKPQSFQEFIDARNNNFNAYVAPNSTQEGDIPSVLKQPTPVSGPNVPPLSEVASPMLSFGVALQSQNFGTHGDTTTSALNGKHVSYVGATSSDPKKHKSNFRRLECSKKTNDVDLSVPRTVVEEVNSRFEKTRNHI